MSAPHSAEPGPEAAAQQRPPIPEPRPADPPAAAPGDVTGPAGDVGGAGAGAGTSTGTATGRRLSIRRLFLVGAIIAAVVGMIALVGAYVVYDKVTELDRSTPGVVVDQYLAATFDQRNDTRAALYSCGDPEKLTEIRGLLADIGERERRFGVTISVAWEGFESTIGGASATVDARLRIQVPEEGGYSSESFQQWRFSLQDRDGWRVCEAHRVA